MGDLTVSAAICLQYLALHYYCYMAVRTNGIDRNEEITSLSPYVQTMSCCRVTLLAAWRKCIRYVNTFHLSSKQDGRRELRTIGEIT